MVPRVQDTDVDYALGILNSKLVSWVYVNTSAIAQKDDFPQVHTSALSAIGLPRSNQSQHDRMVNLVQHMLDLHRKLQAANSAAAKQRLQREIDATDEKIDNLVYELYGLNEEETRIVEGKSY